MRVAKFLRHDEVERPAQSIFLGVAESPLGLSAPMANETFRIHDHDGGFVQGLLPVFAGCQFARIRMELHRPLASLAPLELTWQALIMARLRAVKFSGRHW